MKELHIVQRDGSIKDYAIIMTHQSDITGKTYVIYSDYDLLNMYVSYYTKGCLYPVSDDEMYKLNQLYQAFIEHTDVSDHYNCQACGEGCTCFEDITLSMS